MILWLVIPAKAGIQNRWYHGFRIKCGMTTYLIEIDRLLAGACGVYGQVDKKSQKLDLSRHQKSRLLSLGLGSNLHEPNTDKVEQKADMLYDVLMRTLPVDPSVVNSLPDIVRGLSSRLQSLAGLPIGDLLQDPTTDITTISRIKQYAKESGTSTDSEDRSDVFLVVYYAAIASALVYHNEKITQHSYKDLEQFFYSFIKNNWILYELISLFTRAREYCLEKMQQDDSGSL